ncbi:MAG: ABC transporter ATP-binding protein [Deltaproteobacteria bacterium]|nr:ABC transporter ATP-binding protein [Deltaproteobacteria bacterium]
MLVLGAATAAYAFLAGPALKFIFSGSIVDIIHHADGSLRSMWNWLPPSLLSELEKFAEQSALYMVPILIVIVAFIKGMAQTGQFYLMGKASQRVLLHLRSDAFDSMLKQSPSFFAKRAHGDLLSRLTNDANLVEQAIFYGITPAVREPLSVIFLLVYCFVTNPRLALFTFVIVPLAVLPLVRFSKWLKRVSHRGQTAQGDINAVCYEALAGVRVVQAFGTEKIENQRLEKSASRYFKQMLTSYFIRAVRTPTMEFLGAIALGSLLGLLGYRVRVLGDDPAQYISFFVAVVMMYDPLKKLGQVADYIATGGAAIERIYEIIDSPTDINDCATAYELPPFNNAIVFAGVNFSYNENPVLEYIDLTINRGQVVALVGRSGSGKTTLANLLPRFYDIKGGSLTIDGHALNKVTLASLRKQISVVSQDTFLFNTSIAANIAYGRPDASFDDIKQAAMAAHAVEFIEKLSQGYETVIGERGVTLSGGQRQRLAIARAFLRNAPLLILDEATSSLDVESEHHVQAALDELMTERTCLVIAHRLSTVRRADHIAVLKDGHIIERGRHQQLIELGGEYARLYDMQFQDEKPLATPTNAS